MRSRDCVIIKNGLNKESIMKILILILLSQILVFAQVGKIIYIKGDVFLLRGSKLVPARVGMQLEEKDTLTTKKSSLTKLLLADKSAVSIGSNSEFSIQSYLFDEKKNSHAKFKARKGLFRMITGKIAKISPDRFKLKTKTVTIGIRGTIFSGIIEKKGETFFCEKGAIYITSKGVTIEVAKGYKSHVVPGGNPSKAQKYNASDMKKIRSETSGWKEKECVN